MIELHFFGRLREIAGAAQLAVAGYAEDDLSALLSRIDNATLVTELRRPTVRAVCDGMIVSRNHRVAGASEILFFPPASGG